MSNSSYLIRYPRKVVLRKSMAVLSRMLLGLLTDVEIRHRERLPEKGPIILAGNHVAALEAVLMMAYTPGVVEYIGNGDIPFDPNYAFLANSYGLIPINRGNLDRQGLHMALDVLRQDGILGIFPEGGTWDPAQMQAQSGIAWLSYKAKAPILPIGFGGIKGGLQKALALKHPRLTINIGDLIPPVTLENDTLSKKENLANAAQKVLIEIRSLIPKKDLAQFQHRVDERYHLKVEALYRGEKQDIPDEHLVRHGSAYAQFLFNPTIIDVLVRNLHLPLKPLKQISPESRLEPILKAWQSILDYLEVNPGYFTYRFGVQKGLAVRKALEELVSLGNWALASGFRLNIIPYRKFRNAKTGVEVLESGGSFPSSM
ncbi:MAG: 1-acyl-sn-glycerol-3-phosphate acyltransferase [Anaerolineaceae bacterium]|jgi:1-acyl-sn-glycerol-3-phosphate acyltransferase|nr:1-acyl-sn-glycerol-3-phosphate acyltransferase [Anaerolineaceae bacterium]